MPTKKNKTLIIAEAGVNHNGKLSLAKKLIKIAKNSGADVVKFQTFIPSNLVTNKAKLAKYQKTKNNKTKQINMLEKLSLTKKMHYKLKAYCDKLEIEFCSTAFDIQSLELLLSIGIKRIKIPSGEITNYELLNYISALNYPIILSTGMSDNKEIAKAIKILTQRKIQRKNITVLHCNSSYPTPMKDVNLMAMRSIKLYNKTEIGLSDHSNGIEVPIAAVAMGATIIEKHFTLDRTFEGPDHKSSLSPSELTNMVKSIRNIEIAIGDGIKKITTSESINKNIVRKSLVAAKKIRKGDIFDNENITAKRPGNGLSPMLLNNLIGKKAKRNYLVDELIKKE